MSLLSKLRKKKPDEPVKKEEPFKSDFKNAILKNRNYLEVVGQNVKIKDEYFNRNNQNYISEIQFNQIRGIVVKEEFYEELKNTKIFSSATEFECQAMMFCFKTRFKTFKKNENIISQGEPMEDLVLILKLYFLSSLSIFLFIFKCSWNTGLYLF